MRFRSFTGLIGKTFLVVARRIGAVRSFSAASDWSMEISWGVVLILGLVSLPRYDRRYIILTFLDQIYFKIIEIF